MKKLFLFLLIALCISFVKLPVNVEKPINISKFIGFQEALSGTSTIYDYERTPHWSHEVYFIDTTITKNASYTTKSFDISGFPYHSVQIRVTAPALTPTTISLKYRCAQWDSATYWAVASVDSIKSMVVLAGVDTMVIWGNSDLQIPVTRYIQYIIEEENVNNAVVKIFVGLWRGE